MEGKGSPLMAGVPELLILQILARREMYGYELARTLRVASNESLVLGEGVLYPALHALEQRRLLRSRRRVVDGRTRVYYSITSRGSKRLAALTEQWQRITGAVDAVLQEPRHA